MAIVAGCLLLARGNAGHAETRAEADGSRLQPWSFFGGFTWHDFADPGLHVGAEYSLAATPHFRSLASVSFLAYRDADVETGYALRLRWGQRFTASWGLTFEDQVGVGAQWTRYDTTVFTFPGSVAVASHDTASRIAFSPDIVVGPGYDLQRKLGVPVQVYARTGIMLIYPDLNLAFQLAWLAEFGLRWTPR